MATMNTPKPAAPMSISELRAKAESIAAELKAAAHSDTAIGATGGGSLHRGLPESLRARFIEVRTSLFERGIFDPVLVRFDTATAPQAPTSEIAEQLSAIAASL